MIFGRVLLSLRSRCSQTVCWRSINAVNEQRGGTLYYKEHTPKARTFLPSAHLSGLQATAQPCPGLSDMQPASLPYGREPDVVVSDNEHEEGDGEDLVRQGGTKQKEGIITTGHVGTVGMEVPEGTTDTGASSAPKGLNEKMTKRKVKRERRKLMRRKLKSDDSSANLMSELPFALTSPTTWKELGFPNPDSAQKKRKRKRGDSGGQVDSEEDGDQKKKKKESQRPNYFVSIPITNPQIKSAVSEVQEAILQQEPRLSKAMIPVPTLHITLLVTHLAHQDQLDQAADVLAQVKPSVAELLGGRDLVLPFSGISHFRKEVVFVGLTTGQHRTTLDSLAELLRSRFEEQGLLQGDGRGFEPHLTMMKLSRASKLRSQGLKRVDPALYSNYTNKFFGNQMVERLDLCSMLKKKQQDGYYHTEASLQLGEGAGLAPVVTFWHL